MATDLELVSRSYRELLQLPVSSSARINLQAALGALRDEISYMTGHPPENVQNAFEQWAATTRSIERITK